MNRHLTRGTAVVSGGSRGLGLAIIEYLAAAGWRVITFSRHRSTGLDTISSRYEGGVVWRCVDAADRAAVDEFCKYIKKIPDVGLLVNNVGYVHDGLFVGLSSHEADLMNTINYLTPLALTRTCSRGMTEAGGGKIINISSVNTIRGFRGVSVYTAAKAALDALVRPLARELGPFGISVNSLVCGYFDSELTGFVTEQNRQRIESRTPLGRLGTVEDMLNAVKVLTAPETHFITGQTIVVDGGISC